jgi:Lar family restriction alleviation protein
MLSGVQGSGREGGGVILPVEPDRAHCPFCGSDKTRTQPVNSSSYRRKLTAAQAVFCNSCGARGGREATKELAVIAWNRRAQVAP